VAVDNGTFGTVKDKLMKAHDVAAARAEQPGAAGGAATPAGDGRGYQTRQLSGEIRTSQHQDPPSERRYRAALAFLSLPRPVRTLAWRFLLGNPEWFKRFGGTVGISSVGMFGPAGGWGIPIAPPTLMITVGGIATKPRYVDGELQARELLDLTISVDHEVVDGAPAARFARRLAELVEQAAGL
jgi:2-oxoacid dehydrogenases acyltransferase (catalytic domain)